MHCEIFLYNNYLEKVH